MSRRRLLALGWILLLGLSATLPLSALFQGIIHVGSTTLVLRTPLKAPLISIGSDVDARAGARSIIVDLFGDIRLHGTARDDLVTVGGQIYLSPHAHLQGDVLALFGAIYRAPHVSADGRLGGALLRWDGHSPRSPRNWAALLGTSIRLGLAAGLALLLAGSCLTVVFPWQVVLISTTLRASPIKSLAAGAMILLTFAFLVIPLGLSLAGLPFALLLTGAAALAWLFGMTASAVLLGRLLAHGAESLLWASAAGLVALALIMAVPVVGPLLVTSVGVYGAGALAVALIARARPTSPLP